MNLTQGLTSNHNSNQPVVLQAEGLVKKYGKRTVVDGVSLQVHRGEVVGLLGANGAGKTTCFRMTCGLIPPNKGTIRLGDSDVTDWPMYRRAREGRMGYLPQERSVFGGLTTENNLYIMMELLGFSRRKQRERCNELLEKFHLTKVRKTIVGQGGTGGLSGGERRRLEIARALLSEPKIILLDEPFANIDPNTVTEIQKMIRTLSTEGIAVLITDHQVVETLEITDRSYVIYDGRVLCCGTPDEVLSNPDAQKHYFGEKALLQLKQVQSRQGTTGEKQPATPTAPETPSRKPTVSTPLSASSGNSGFVVKDSPQYDPKLFVVPPRKAPNHAAAYDEFVDDIEDENRKFKEKRRSIGLKRPSE